MQTGLFSKPTILVGEGPEDMPEMVIDKRAFSQISPETKRALFREIRGIKGFEQGLYNSEITNASGATAPASADTNSAQTNMVMALMAKNIEFLQELKESGVIAYISKDFREMKKLQEQLDKYNALRDKNKQ
jgi:tubulin-specific chaperone A